MHSNNKPRIYHVLHSDNHIVPFSRGLKIPWIMSLLGNLTRMTTCKLTTFTESVYKDDALTVERITWTRQFEIVKLNLFMLTAVSK